jgi:hypothetical protein
MSKVTIVIIIYIFGLIFGALFLDLWSSDTSVFKGLLGLGWTALLLIGLFFADKNEKRIIFLNFVIIPLWKYLPAQQA